MNGIQRIAGINFTASRLQFVEVEKQSNQLFINNIGQTFISPIVDFDEQSELNLFNQLQAAFDEIKIRNPVLSNIASFTLPPELFITIQLPYDSNLNQNELKEEFMWEISQLFPYIPIDELAIKIYELDSSFFPGKNNALVVALQKKYLILIKNFCNKNNLSPKLVDNASITANSFINSMSSREKDCISFNLYNSKNLITLFVNVSSKPVYVKVIQKEHKALMGLISSELNKEEFIKVRSLKSTYSNISGEELEEDSISELNNETGLVFNQFNPFDILKFKSGYQNFEIHSDSYSSFTSAAGIASRFI
jgi:Tfp pilus assembly PilM family ATPase